MKMRKCPNCGNTLPESEFYDKNESNTLQSHCIMCCREHGRLRNGGTGVYKDKSDLPKEDTKVEKYWKGMRNTIFRDILPVCIQLYHEQDPIVIAKSYAERSVGIMRRNNKR